MNSLKKQTEWAIAHEMQLIRIKADDIRDAAETIRKEVLFHNGVDDPHMREMIEELYEMIDNLYQM